MFLPLELQEKYKLLKSNIRKKLIEFEQVPKEKYFYELCFCLCTPQSKAESASKVQAELEKLDFLHKEFDPTPLLRKKENYIRFHNQKAKRLNEAKENWDTINKILNSPKSGDEKRYWLYKNVKGIGLKESAHFLRNIGYKNLGILDRHILKHLKLCQVIDEDSSISSEKKYLEVEEKFRNFAKKMNIKMDELDLLFWSYETGEILK